MSFRYENVPLVKHFSSLAPTHLCGAHWKCMHVGMSCYKVKVPVLLDALGISEAASGSSELRKMIVSFLYW